MTVCVAFINGPDCSPGAYLATDTRSTQGGIRVLHPQKKWTHVGPIYAAASGPHVTHEFIAKALQRCKSFTVDEITTRLREILDDADWPSQTHPQGEARTRSFSILLTDGHHLIELDESLHGLDHGIDQLAAIGAGWEIALGAGHALLQAGNVPADVVRGAAEVACNLSIYCGRPIDFIRVPVAPGGPYLIGGA